MGGFLERIFGRGNKGSGSKAKDRLQFILVHDRINLPPERLRQMKEEILEVISKYVSVDRDRVDIALEQRARNSKIVAEIPFQKGKLPVQSDDIESEPDVSAEPPAAATTKIDVPDTTDESAKEESKKDETADKKDGEEKPSSSGKKGTS